MLPTDFAEEPKKFFFRANSHTDVSMSAMLLFGTQFPQLTQRELDIKASEFPQQEFPVPFFYQFLKTCLDDLFFAFKMHHFKGRFDKCFVYENGCFSHTVSPY